MSKLSAVFYGALICAGLAEMRGCSDRDGAQKKLEDLGYKNIEYVGQPWAAFAGGGGDLYADEFKATPPGAEKQVDVVMTRGFWNKGFTPRFK